MFNRLSIIYRLQLRQAFNNWMQKSHKLNVRPCKVRPKGKSACTWHTPFIWLFPLTALARVGYLQTTLQLLEEVYSVYCGISLTDGAVSVTATTITWQTQQLISVLRNGGNTTYGEGAMYYNNINAFFNTIYGGKYTYMSFSFYLGSSSIISKRWWPIHIANFIHATLDDFEHLFLPPWLCWAGGSGGGVSLPVPLINIILQFAQSLLDSSTDPFSQSPLQICANAVLQKWQLPTQIKQAFDDRVSMLYAQGPLLRFFNCEAPFGKKAKKLQYN